MKMLHTNAAVDFSAAGLNETRRFGFEMNAIAFHAVIDGIYSNKIEAPVREYATNAYDAHRLVGKDDVPFLIMAPSTLNPYFMVRDFGPGMDHEEVTVRATTLFGSNKRDRNDQVGMLGLGMKSAFAYTKQYTITCFDGTEKREYICFLDEGGSPTVSSIGAQPSNEPAGVMVKFPVQQGDIYRFQSAISKVMIGFDPMPEVLNDVWKPSAATTLMQGDGYRLVQSNYIKGPTIRQGCVLYPLDLSEITEENNYYDNQIPVIIDVPIGTASVSTSREQLGYDEPTKTNLRPIWAKVRADIGDQISKQVQEIDDFHEACNIYGKVRSSLPTAVVHTINDLIWRDKYQVRTKFEVSGHTSSKFRANLLAPNDNLEWSSSKKDPLVDPLDLQDTIIAWESVDCTFGKERLRGYRQQNPDQNVLWVKEPTTEGARKYFGIETVVDLRNYERVRLVRPKVERATFKKEDIRALNRHRFVLGHVPERAIYVFSEGHDYQVLGQTLKYDQVQDKYVKLLRNVNADGDRTFIVLLKNQRKMAEDQPGWIHLDELITNIVGDFDVKAYLEHQDARRFLSLSVVQSLRQHREQLPKRLRSLIEQAEAIEPVVWGDDYRFLLWKHVNGHTELPKIKAPFQERFKKITERYPLLEMVRHNTELLTHYLNLIAR